MNNLKIEFRTLTNDDYSTSPSCFQNEFPGETVRLIRHDNCGMLLVDGDRPHYYFHNMDESSSRWSAFIRLGDGAFALQDPVHGEDMAQTNKTTMYGIMAENPLYYGVRTIEGPEMEFLYNEEGCVWKEGKDGSILNVKGTWFPYGLVCHMGSEYNIPFIHQPVYLEGTYEGKPIKFLACIDRIFSPKGKETEILKDATSYLSSYCSGIREDGRREWFMALMRHKNGKGLGIYWLEGEEPIISEEVTNEAVWEKLPYVDDHTMVAVDNVWKFGDKTFHVKGYWGAKGFTAQPRFDRHGQSQIFGNWYEGEEPYQHTVWNTFSENMDAYEDSLKEMGIKVKE